jgi:PHD/YefM family antitoxin component YafN of YafNO toxin-antitoxin module
MRTGATVPGMADVLPSAEARQRLPSLINEIVAHPERAVNVGRQRRREVVIVNAERYDQLIQREDAVRDIAWTLFAQERTEHPTGDPISWEEAQRLRSRG